MKLTPVQVRQTLDQFEAQAVPESHPAIPELTGLFGEHTFFLDGQGLNIVEPLTTDGARGDGTEGEGTKTGRVINIASWTDASLTKLAPHEPEETEIAIDLAA